MDGLKDKNETEIHILEILEGINFAEISILFFIKLKTNTLKNKMGIDNTFI